ncbi:MAG TPA: PH domain-containing protein, partial [Acidimicrobiia bacterium]|nr:PH domain-containing protein [Acidimicrobiia bacterium]
IALFTALGAFAVGLGGVLIAALFAGSWALLAAGSVLAFAALATFAPAVGALSATVDADSRGIAVRRFGRTSRYAWSDVVEVTVVERRASVPDGTEYHWVVPSRSAHVVAVPCLELADGRLRQLPALAAPAAGPRSAAAREHAELLGRIRTLTIRATAAEAATVTPVA